MSGVAPTTPPELLGSRSSRLLGRLRPSGLLVALVSTVVVFGVLGYLIVTSPGWPEVQRSFFNAEIFWETLPTLLRALVKHIELFLLAEVFILIFALVLAVMRSLPGPVFFPFRLMAVIYIDVFRAIPGILVIFVLGFGIPGLRLPNVTTDGFVWGLVALVILWSAYVAEVYRAGIESIHPSQEAAARSLGLSRFQALRRVILPQAIRRVIPPLLNDFIGLQKDTALVAFLGVIDAFNQAQIDSAATFTYGSYLAAAALFVAITIPLARLTDWLIARDREKRQATGAVA